MTFEFLTGWHWLAVGVVLFLVGAFGAGSVFIGAGCGAIAVALVLAVISVSWQVQLACFGVFFVIATIVHFVWFRVKPPKNETARVEKRAARLIGRKASLLAAVKSGYGKVQIQDAIWTVTCEENLPVGHLVEVIGYEKAVLQVVRA